MSKGSFFSGNKNNPKVARLGKHRIEVLNGLIHCLRICPRCAPLTFCITVHLFSISPTRTRFAFWSTRKAKQNSKVPGPAKAEWGQPLNSLILVGNGIPSMSFVLAGYTLSFVLRIRGYNMLDWSYFTVTTFASSVDESQVTLLDSWVGEFSVSLVGEMVFDRRANSVKKKKEILADT